MSCTLWAPSPADRGLGRNDRRHDARRRQRDLCRRPMSPGSHPQLTSDRTSHADRRRPPSIGWRRITATPAASARLALISHRCRSVRRDRHCTCIPQTRVLDPAQRGERLRQPRRMGLADGPQVRAALPACSAWPRSEPSHSRRRIPAAGCGSCGPRPPDRGRSLPRYSHPSPITQSAPDSQGGLDEKIFLRILDQTPAAI